MLRNMEFLKHYIPNLSKCHIQETLLSIVSRVYNELENRITCRKQRGTRMKGEFASLCIHAKLPSIKKDGYNVSPVTKQLIRIIKEGPEYGIHVILHSLTYQGFTWMLLTMRHSMNLKTV